ncbi:MAG: hypothetical protein ACR2OX_05705 [Methyloligellaceae bacterium]
MSFVNMITVALMMTFSQPADLVPGGHPDSFAAQECGDGYKWDASKGKCVRDPFSGGY